MSRRQGGYVLIYVVVVIAILCIVSLTVSGIALHNYQTQQASLRRAQATYAAEGEMERFVAILPGLSCASGDDCADQETATSAAKTAIEGAINTAAGEVLAYSWDGSKLSFTIEKGADGATVTAKITVTVQIMPEEIPHKDEDGNDIASTYKCTISIIGYEYKTYQVTYGA